MRRMTGTVSALIACGLLALHAQPQATPQQSTPPPFRAGVDVVQLDVSVLDEDRRPVKGLAAADFTVLESGDPQPIVAFEAVDIPDAGELPAPWMQTASTDVITNEATTRRIVVIVLDDAFIGLDPWNIKTVKHIAHDVVDRLGPADLAAVTFTESGKRQDITSDRARLLTAIDSFVPHPVRATPLGMSAARGGAGSLRSEMSGGAYGSPCAFRGKLRSIAACVLDTFITAGEALRAAPQGRKTIVYISGGPPFDFSMTDLRGGQPPPGEEVTGIQAVLRSFHEANINVYAVDPTGVSAAGIMAPRLDALRIFAEDTGGRATINTNTPWDAVPQIFRENSSYYMLGVRTSGRADGKFHRVQVKVNRPGADVRARNGYYSPAPANARTAPLDEAIGQAVPGGALLLAVNLVPFAEPGERSAAVIVRTRLLEPAAAGQTLDVATLVLDSDCGDCRKLPSSRQTFTLAGSGAEDARAEVRSRVALPPGRYEIRVAASLNGRTGGVFGHVDVPDFRKDKLSASGLVLTTQRAPASGAIPYAPTVSREFRPDTAVSAFLRIHQGGSGTPGAVRVNATIVNEGARTDFDETKFFDSDAFRGSRSVDYRLDLPTSTLASGRHLLTIEAHFGDTLVRRQTAFTIK